MTIRKYFLTIFTRRCCLCWQNMMLRACFVGIFRRNCEHSPTNTHTHTHVHFSTVFMFYCIVFSIELNFEKCCPETPSKWATTENMPLVVGVALISAEITCQFLRETLLRCPKCMYHHIASRELVLSVSSVNRTRSNHERHPICDGCHIVLQQRQAR